MAQVFTSYSRRDTEIVDQIVEELTRAGITVWIDREAIKAGNQWRVQIVEAIDTCHAFLLMISPNSAASDNVRKEIDLAQDSGRTTFAVMLEPTRLPAAIRYQLAGLQFIDVGMLGYEKAVPQLIETLKEHLKKFEPAETPGTRQAELVIQGIDLKSFSAEKQEQLLDFLAQLTSASRSQLQIANLTAGSVHVFIDMPALAAYELKTLAFNRDPRLTEMGIVSLRLDGNTRYVNTSLGSLTAAATVGPLTALWLKIPALLAPILGPTAGKLLTVLLAATLIAGAGIAAPRALAPVFPPPSTEMPLSTSTSTPLPPATQTPTGTATPTATEAPTATPTATQTSTRTASPTPVPTFAILRGEVVNRTACRYGPGDIYLYQFGLIPGNRVEVSGRVDLQARRGMETWLWGLPEGYPSRCWVNARDIELGGEPASLEIVYPDKVRLPITFNWPAPENVEARRSGDLVTVTWDFFELPPGEDENPQSARYVAEFWLCRDGEIVFTPVGAWGAFLEVLDEAGCQEPSHGRIYLAEKHGYVGPVEIPWPPHATPTP